MKEVTDFYEKQYLNLLEENKGVAEKRNFAFGLFTSLIVITIFPILEMILAINSFALRVTALTFFAMFCINILVNIAFIIYINFMKFKEYEITNLQETEDSYNEICDRYVTDKEGLEKEINKGFREHYIQVYNALYKAIQERRKRINISLLILTINILWEIIICIFIIINKIFI